MTTTRVRGEPRLSPSGIIGVGCSRAPKELVIYTTCTRGHRHWGVSGAAGALLVAPGDSGPQVLLTLRSPQVHQGSTWSVPGGAIDAGEDPHAAACREVSEELGIEVAVLPVLEQHVFECGGWRYTTVLLAAPAPTALSVDGWETDEVRWFDVHDVDRLEALHPAFATSWPALRTLVVAGRGRGVSPAVPPVEAARSSARRPARRASRRG